MPKTEAITVPIKDLDDRTHSVAEHKEITQSKVAFKLVFDENRKGVYRFTLMRCSA